MKKLWKISSVVVLSVLSVSTAVAQGSQMLGPIPATSETGVLDGVYLEENVPTKRVIPQEHIREADAIFSKRVWRAIDLREKINLPLYYPLEKSFSNTNMQTGVTEYKTYDNNRQWSLWSVIRYHAYTKVANGRAPDLTIYFACEANDCEGGRPEDGDQFKYPWIPPGGNYADSNYLKELAIAFNKVTPGSLVEEYNADGSLKYNPDGSIVMRQEPDVVIPITSEEIVQYHLKEDWIFDKERSVMEPRILGIAPVVYNKEGQQIKGYKRLFWLYFPECRYVFQNYFTWNDHNDARRMSYDDLFLKRKFNSYILKQSNVYDRSIEQYKAGVDALLESEKIKDNLFRIEHDVWHF